MKNTQSHNVFFQRNFERNSRTSSAAGVAGNLIWIATKTPGPARGTDSRLRWPKWKTSTSTQSRELKRDSECCASAENNLNETVSVVHQQKTTSVEALVDLRKYLRKSFYLVGVHQFLDAVCTRRLYNTTSYWVIR